MAGVVFSGTIHPNYLRSDCDTDVCPSDCAANYSAECSIYTFYDGAGGLCPYPHGFVLCQWEIPNGYICYWNSSMSYNPCLSGNCYDIEGTYDDICCDTACDGICESCDGTYGTEGTCSYITSGDDPEDECNSTSWECYAEGSRRMLPGYCSGSGSCAGYTYQNCTTGYDCDTGTDSCYTDCATNDDTKCTAGYHCDSGDNCVADLSNGQTCVEDSDCASGDCGLKPDGSWVCVDSQYECASQSGPGVDTGYTECYGNDVYTCNSEDSWGSADCYDDCGYYPAVDNCTGGSCESCASSCTMSSQCDVGASCVNSTCMPLSNTTITLYYNETTGQYETPGEYISSSLDTNSSGNYYCELDWSEEKPAGTDIVLQLRSGSSDPPTGDFLGVDASSLTNYSSHPAWINETHNLDRYMQWKSVLSTTNTFITPVLYSVSITYTDDGDAGEYDCECLLRDEYSGACNNGNQGCWDYNKSMCCGDDDNSSDYFYTDNLGGCVVRGGNAEYDTVAPYISSVDSDITDYYYYNETSSTSGIVYFNSALANGRIMNFTVDWTDANTDLGYDILNASTTAGLAGTVTGNSGQPSKILQYLFNAGDSSGIMNLFVRDAVHLNDSTAITFTEDTADPSGSVSINDGAAYTEKRNVTLSINFSDNIEVRDCAYNNDGLAWAGWENCTDSKQWILLGEDGTREVFLRIRDLAGNVINVSDTIILDRTKPGIVIKDNDTYTNTTQVNLTMDFDKMSGSPVECYFRNDSSSWMLWGACPSWPSADYPVINWSIFGIEGKRMVSIKTNTTLGTMKEANDTIVYDSTQPSGYINIYALNIPGFHERNENYTAYTTVQLELDYFDAVSGVGYCRYANEAAENFTGWESCTSVKTWILDEDDGLKTVYYQIRDNAGNTVLKNDTIYLNKTGAGLDVTPPNAPTVVDDGEWTNDSTTLHAEWYGAYDHESELLGIPLVYNYSVGTSPGAADVVNWSYAGEVSELNISGLSLIDNITYYVNVRVINSGGLINESSSNGITVDTTAPGITSLTSSHAEAAWNNESNEPEFNWQCGDPVSGVYAYSYALDQNPGSIPDAIPEGDPGNLSAETSIGYSSIIDGKLHFHARCRDNAGNWGNAEHYEIWIDLSPPSVPQIQQPNVTTNQSLLRYYWTESFDLESGLRDYYFELYNSSEFVPANRVNYSRQADNNITLFVSSGITYYARVNARNNANLSSRWSSQVSAEIDEDAPDLDIIVPGWKDYCNVYSPVPVLRVMTDEPANCTFKEPGAVTFNNLEYTFSEYHESLSWLMTDGQHTFEVRCRDKIGNQAEENRTFDVDTGASISIANVSLQDYFTNMNIGFGLELENELGGVDERHYNITLDGESLDFAVTDMGCGDYIVSITTPSKAGNYSLNITAGSDREEYTLKVEELILNAEYTSGSMPGQVKLDKIAYAGSGTKVGFATDSRASSPMNDSGSIELASNSYDGSMFLFATSGGGIDARDEILREKRFFELQNPSFGEVIEKNIYRTAIIVKKDDVELSGIDELGPGDHKLIIKKTVKEDGKTRVRITDG